MTTFINIQGYRHDILIRVIEKKEHLVCQREGERKKKQGKYLEKGEIFGK